jgi:hypothetical protein
MDIINVIYSHCLCLRQRLAYQQTDLRNKRSQSGLLCSATCLSSDELTTFFHQHKVTRKSAITRRLSQIKEGMALTEDESVIQTMALLVKTWIQQLKILDDFWETTYRWLRLRSAS